jgi:hypothetical protein
MEGQTMSKHKNNITIGTKLMHTTTFTTNIIKY